MEKIVKKRDKINIKLKKYQRKIHDLEYQLIELEREANEIDQREIINQMNGARFLNEQRELISNYKGKNFDLSFRVNSVDRTFGIGISEEYRRGNTLNVTSESNEIEVRMRNDYDISDISSGREMSLKVSVVDWNSIRKKLVVNSV